MTSTDRTASPPGSGRTVLVVEDDAGVREMVALILRRAGYRVLEAPTPMAALDLLGLGAAHGSADAGTGASAGTGRAASPGADADADASVDILLTDLQMSGMSGLDLVGLVRGSRPGLPALLMSGHGAQAAAGTGSLPGRVAILPKPFAKAALLRVLYETLELRDR